MSSTSGIQPARPRPAPKRPQVSRRSFLRRAWLTGLFASLAGFGAGTIYFLWPNLSGGFGTKIKAGTKTSIDADIKANGGYMALYQRCVHLGCRVPWCATSQWWECPCHGSKYNQAGEYKEGPAPRGLDRFAVLASGDQITVDTSKIITGPPRGTNTTGQELEGPHCVGGAAQES